MHTQFNSSIVLLITTTITTLMHMHMYMCMCMHVLLHLLILWCVHRINDINNGLKKKKKRFLHLSCADVETPLTIGTGDDVSIFVPFPVALSRLDQLQALKLRPHFLQCPLEFLHLTY